MAAKNIFSGMPSEGMNIQLPEKTKPDAENKRYLFFDLNIVCTS